MKTLSFLGFWENWRNCGQLSRIFYNFPGSHKCPWFYVSTNSMVSTKAPQTSPPVQLAETGVLGAFVETILLVEGWKHCNFWDSGKIEEIVVNCLGFLTMFQEPRTVHVFMLPPIVWSPQRLPKHLPQCNWLRQGFWELLWRPYYWWKDENIVISEILGKLKNLWSIV